MVASVQSSSSASCTIGSSRAIACATASPAGVAASARSVGMVRRPAMYAYAHEREGRSMRIMSTALMLLTACAGPAQLGAPQRSVTYFEGTSATSSPDGATAYGPPKAVL